MSTVNDDNISRFGIAPKYSQLDAELHAWLSELGAEEVVTTSVDAYMLAARLQGKVGSLA